MGGASHAAPRRSYPRAAQPQEDVPQESVPIFDDYPPLQPYRKYIMHRPEYTRINFGDPGVKRVDYTTKQRGAAFKERKENPYDYEKYITDRRFWSKFQADWYISVFIEKKNAITISKYINWVEMSEKNNPTFDLVTVNVRRNTSMNSWPSIKIGTMSWLLNFAPLHGLKVRARIPLFTSILKGTLSGFHTSNLPLSLSLMTL
jgi:hypothetical protein